MHYLSRTGLISLTLLGLFATFTFAAPLCHTMHGIAHQPESPFTQKKSTQSSLCGWACYITNLTSCSQISFVFLPSLPNASDHLHLARTNPWTKTIVFPQPGRAPPATYGAIS